MSTLLKVVTPGGWAFTVPGVTAAVSGWCKAIAVGGEGGGGDGTRPPLAPTRFAAQLKEKKFTNNADLKVVCDLVRAASAPPTPHAPLPPPSRPLHSTSERCARDPSAQARGWCSKTAVGPTRRRRSWA